MSFQVKLTREAEDDLLRLYDFMLAREIERSAVVLDSVFMNVCKPVGEYALSTNKGKTHVAAETLSEWANLVAAEAGIGSFQAKRIRSGVETLLARVKIPKDDRGRLQSHGITGVQARHYDGHDYIDEKRNAVVALFNVLDAPDAGNVVALPSKSA